MNFSTELVELAKTKMNLRTDADLLKMLTSITKQNLSSAKSGKRPLTEEQAIEIAEKCELNAEWVLVSLAAENTKYESARKVWSNLAKKLLTGALMLCVLKISGSYLVPDFGKHRFLARSRLFA